MPIKHFLLSWIVFLNISNASAEPIITRVMDGDTVSIKDNNQTYKLRLLDIDAPELHQAYGKKAKRALVQLCQSKQSTLSVTVELQGFDKYGRQLGYLYCNQINASHHLVKQGLAWFNTPYSTDLNLQAAEALAREQQLGLWRQSKPIPPWEWRKLHTYQYHN